VSAAPDPEYVNSWWHRAACKGQTPLFFAYDEFSQHLAVNVCRQCPVLAECRADVMAAESRGAEASGAVYGVVAGLLPEQRGSWR
jgi:hypothetical protein